MMGSSSGLTAGPRRRSAALALYPQLAEDAQEKLARRLGKVVELLGADGA